jgi:iron complex outermembrane receptor protein
MKSFFITCRVGCAVLMIVPTGFLTKLAWADTTPSDALEEVVVTAERREENLTQVPASITVFNQQSIEANNLVNILDYAQKTPNVTVIDFGTRNTNQIAMRGISNQSGSLDQPFALYVDDFAVQGIITNPNLQDAERIEVLRGPQGTFFGRNAEAGAFNITTNKPGPTYEESGYFQGGNFGTYEFGNVINVPVSDKFFVRAVATLYTTNGSVRNVNAVGGTSSDQYVDARVSARYLATDRLTFDFTAIYDDEKIGLTSLVSTGYLAANTKSFYGISAPVLSGLPVYPQNTNEVDYGYPDHQEVYYHIFNGRIKYDFDGFSVTSISGYGRSTRKISEGIAEAEPDWFNLFSTSPTETYSEEVRAASSGPGRFQWTAGAIYAYDSYDLQENVFTTDTPNTFGLPPGFEAENLTIHRWTDSTAAFGNVDFQLIPALTLSYGGRYTSDTTFLRNSYTGPIGPFSNLGPASFNNYSNKVAVRYDVASDLSAYVLASQGYRTGGVQAGPDPTYLPETLWNYEAGIKGSFADQRVRFSLSAFRMNWSNMQVVTYVSTPPPNVSLLTITTNAAKSHSQGAELDIRAKPIPEFELGAGIGYDLAKFDRFPDAVISGVNGPADLSGRPMIQAPKVTANADAQYNFPIGSYHGFVRAEGVYSSSYANSLIALVPGAVPYFPYYTKAYAIANFRAGVSWEHYTFTAYVQNAFGNDYYTGVYDNLIASGAQVAVHPRIFGAKFDFKF